MILLLLLVIVYAVAWLPINAYNVLNVLEFIEFSQYRCTSRILERSQSPHVQVHVLPSRRYDLYVYEPDIVCASQSGLSQSLREHAASMFRAAEENC